MKFSIKDFFSKCDQTTIPCGSLRRDSSILQLHKSKILHIINARLLPITGNRYLNVSIIEGNVKVYYFVINKISDEKRRETLKKPFLK